MHHHRYVEPRTRFRRRAFAALRIAQLTTLVVGLLCAVMPFTVPRAPGQPGRELYFMAWSTPGEFVTVGAAIASIGVALTVIGIPLKRRWKKDLRGWIE